MRIGLDIASYSALPQIHRIGLVTADTDCIPAMKHARKLGVQIALFYLPGQPVSQELRQHADLIRDMALPACLLAADSVC